MRMMMTMIMIKRIITRQAADTDTEIMIVVKLSDSIHPFLSDVNSYLSSHCKHTELLAETQ